MNQTISVLVRKAVDSNARVIQITSPVFCSEPSESDKLQLQSPCFLVYTRLGLVPFVTSDLMEKYINVKLPPAIAVPISTVLEHSGALEASRRGLHDFTAVRISGKRPLVYLTANDCVPTCETFEKVDQSEERVGLKRAKNAKLTVWTRHGRTNVNCALLNKLVGVVQPSMLQLGIGMQLDAPTFTFTEREEPDGQASSYLDGAGSTTWCSVRQCCTQRRVLASSRHQRSGC